MGDGDAEAKELLLSEFEEGKWDSEEFIVLCVWRTTCSTHY